MTLMEPAQLIDKSAFEAACQIARQQLHAIWGLPDSPFGKTPQPGYRRGIDFYNQPRLISALALSLVRYQDAHNTLPDLVNPRGFNEKIIWSKFFAEMKVPESGNKLLTSAFIPKDMRHEIGCAEIAWHSPEATLPRNEMLRPGGYYLKANHGSGMFGRLQYPLAENDFSRIETIGRKWLGHPFGLEDGEWWYSAFPKRLLLEKEIGHANGILSWDFYVFGGEVGFIAVIKKLEVDDQSTWLDAGFNILPYQHPKRARVNFEPPCDQLKERLTRYARRIGGQFRFARVDFLIDASGAIYLGEVTFSPGNGLTPRPAEVDLALGEKWSLG